MTETNFWKLIRFSASADGHMWVAEYLDGLSHIKWVGSGRTKAEAFDDLIEEIFRDARIGAKK